MGGIVIAVIWIVAILFAVGAFRLAAEADELVRIARQQRIDGEAYGEVIELPDAAKIAGGGAQHSAGLTQYDIAHRDGGL